jgi:hypothetical protein
MIKTEFGTVVVDTNLVPYMRARDIEFTGRNLKPGKIASIFFDDIAVNRFCQVANKVEIDAKKVLVKFLYCADCWRTGLSGKF